MGNLRTAAVHDDRVQTHLTQKDHVFGEALLQMVIDHGIAAVFDDDTLAGELLQPWQRVNKHPGPFNSVDNFSLFCDAGDAIAAGCYKQPTGLFVSFRSRR